jgi:hypothetical protein
LTSGNAVGISGQRLRDRLREPLRLHQRLAAGSDLRRAAAGRREREDRQHDQADQADAEHRQQDALLLGRRALADQRQGGAERRRAGVGPAGGSR